MGLTKREIGHLIGLVMSDGGFTNYNKQIILKFNKKERDSAEYTLSLLKKIPNRRSNYNGILLIKGNEIMIQDSAIVKLCKKYGMSCTANKQFISDKMRNECLAWKLGFVGGFYSGDCSISYQKNKTRAIRIEQADNKPEKLINKKMCLDFCKEIIESLGLKTCYYKYGSKKKGNGGPSYILNILFKGNKNTAFIFRDYFHLHNKQKEDVLDKLVEIEEKINNKS